MPSLSEFPLDKTYFRVLYLGNSGAGKTGSLVSLVKAGYKLRLIDLDSGFGILQQYVLHECPELIDNVSVISYRDKYKASPGGVQVVGMPKTYIRVMEALDKWPDDDSDPAEWGPDCILVLDSLTALGQASFDWQERLNPSLKDRRQIFRLAQDAIKAFLKNLTGEAFHTHVIVITHVRYNEAETKGFPTSIGSAIGPEIPSMFNNYVCAEVKGQGKTASRVIRTVTNGVLDLKNEKPFTIEQELPLSSGLATLFEQLKGK